MLDRTNADTLKSLAPKCQRDHVCLENSDAVLCKIDYCINEKVLFVKTNNESYCPYRNDFGHSYFCTCPVRMKIYQESGGKPN